MAITDRVSACLKMYADDSSSCSSNSSSEDQDRYYSSPATRGGETSAAGGTSAVQSSHDDGGPPRRRPLPPPTIARSIIHLDVDCFYCQCEELADPKGNLSSSPLAVGQKHIIVTCNYVARSRGVKKLMLRTDAKRICPDLVIVEGSDLEPYRRQARKIYNSFRRAVASLPGGAIARKGGMDEMWADVSAAVDSSLGRQANPTIPEVAFVYGEDSSSSIVSIAEDQTGATAHINSRHGSGASEANDDDDRWGDRDERGECVRRLRAATEFADIVRRAVRNETGFIACVGISSSAMLAKIASELRKPNSLNLLYPWRSSGIINTMPLRKIPGLGSRTLKSLESCLEEHNVNDSSRDQDWWACRDLLRVPQSAVISSLATQKAFESSCKEQCDLLLQRCRGIDPVQIIDDNGGLAKTVSVEDSSRRGTVTTRDGVLHALERLLIRLPRLLDDRMSDSDRPELSYPTTLRFSVRMVDVGCNTKNRPSVTTSSKQCSFAGKKLIQTDDAEQRSAILRDAVLPLVECLLFQHAQPIDVTKLNIATSNFADLSSGGSASGSGWNKKMTQFFATKSADKEASLVSNTGQMVWLQKGVCGEKRKGSPRSDGSTLAFSNKHSSPSPRSTFLACFQQKQRPL